MKPAEDPIFSRTSALSGTEQLADEILNHMSQRPILLMEGNLGTGKTTLAKILLKKLGVQSDVTSPTFNIVNEYMIADGHKLYHFDLYRIRHVEELLEIGFFEYLESGAPCLIEWPEIAYELIPDPALKLLISYEADQRTYTLWNLN